MAVAKRGLRGYQAAKRVRPVLEAGMKGLIKASLAIGKEWDKLTDPDDQKTFLEELGLSETRVRTYAKIGREYPAKRKLLGQKINADVLGIEHMREIVDTPDTTLKKAAKAGMFERPAVPKRDIQKLRQTGQVPAPKPTKPVVVKPPTPAQRIKTAMGNAEYHLERAGRDLAAILNVMEANNITQVRGPEARRLVKAFERLCAQMAAASPETSERAFQILRGEA